MNIYKIISVFLLLAVSSPFIASADELIRSSDLERPGWMESLPPGDEDRWYVGKALEARGLKEGKVSAIKAVAVDIVKSQGLLEGSASFERERRMLSEKLVAGLNSGGRVSIPGIKMLDGYFEEWLHTDGRIYFKVFVLLKYEQAYFREKLQEFDLEFRKLLNSAENIFREAKKKELGDKVPLLAEYSRAFKLVSAIPTISGQQKLQDNIQARIENIVSNISFTFYENEEEQTIIKGLRTPVMLKALYGGTTPLVGLPIKLSLQEGKGTLKKTSTITDDAGIARCHILDIDSAEAVIKAELANDITDPALVPNLLYKISPSAEKTLFKKLYVAGIDKGEAEETIYFSRLGTPVASLSIKIMSPGGSTDIVLEMKPVKEYMDCLSCIPLPADTTIREESEYLSISTDDVLDKDSWTIPISFLEAGITVADYRSKRFLSTFTAPFIGFEEIRLIVRLELK